MACNGDYDDELFTLNLDDLINLWLPSNELIGEDADDDVVPMEFVNENVSDCGGARDEADETFCVQPVSTKILQEVFADMNVNNEVLLPSRIDCSAHSFNSIGKTDSFNALKSDTLYASQYISVFKKLNKIWAVNSTRLGRETFDHYLNQRKILKPHRIRWNRIYDAVSSFQIYSISLWKFLIYFAIYILKYSIEYFRIDNEHSFFGSDCTGHRL